MPIYERVDSSPDWNQLCPEWYLDPKAPAPVRRWEFSAPVHEAECGSVVPVTVKLFDRERIMTGTIVELTILRDFHPEEKKSIVMTESGIVVETMLDRPGFVRLGLRAADTPDGAYGIGFSIRKIVPAPEVEGFDEYWKGQLKRLADVPMRVLFCEKVAYPDYPGIVSYDVRVQSFDETPVSGILSMPENAAPQSLPAYLFMHGAGVRPAFPPLPWAKHGFLAFNINAHGLPNFETADYYQRKASELNGYQEIKSENPEKIPFNGMALRVVRALEYLKSRPEWNGKILIVHGGSQGGWQSLVACALDRDVTFAEIEAPAMCNLAGSLEGRTVAWPGTVSKELGDTPATRAARLFDGVAFARRAKAPAVITVGYSDCAALPSSVISAYHAYGGETKALWCFTDLGHEAAVFWSGEKNILEAAGLY